MFFHFVLLGSKRIIRSPSTPLFELTALCVLRRCHLCRLDGICCLLGILSIQNRNASDHFLIPQCILCLASMTLDRERSCVCIQTLVLLIDFYLCISEFNSFLEATLIFTFHCLSHSGNHRITELLLNGSSTYSSDISRLV